MSTRNTRKRSRSASGAGIGNLPTNLVLVEMAKHLNRANLSRLGLAVPQHRQLHTNVAQQRKQEVKEMQAIVSVATQNLFRLQWETRRMSRTSVNQRKAWVDKYVKRDPGGGFRWQTTSLQNGIPIQLVGTRYYVAFMRYSPKWTMFSVRRRSDNVRVFWARFEAWNNDVYVEYGTMREQTGDGTPAWDRRTAEPLIVQAALKGMLDGLWIALPRASVEKIEKIDYGLNGNTNGFYTSNNNN